MSYMVSRERNRRFEKLPLRVTVKYSRKVGKRTLRAPLRAHQRYSSRERGGAAARRRCRHGSPRAQLPEGPSPEGPSPEGLSPGGPSPGAAGTRVCRQKVHSPATWRIAAWSPERPGRDVADILCNSSISQTYW